MKTLLFLLFLLPLTLLAQKASIQEAQELIDSKEFARASEMLYKMLEEDEDNVLAIEKLGDISGHQKDWDGAIKQYKRLVKLSPKNAEYQYKYGGSLGMKALGVSKFRALMMIDDIKRAFHKAANLDAEHINARWALVELYMQLPGIVGGSKRKSLKYANELEALSKVDGYLAKGYIYEYDDEPQDAEKYYKKAIEVGGSITCFQKLTDLYEKKTKEPNKAIANIEAAHKKHQRNALHYQIGKVAAMYNVQLDKGQKCLHTFIENHTVKDGVPIEWAYYRLAQIYRYKGDKENASVWIEKALTKRKDFKQAVEEQGLIEAL